MYLVGECFICDEFFRVVMMVNEKDILKDICMELRAANNLKRQELSLQWFFIELIEEVLPIDDGKKRVLHERSKHI